MIANLRSLLHTQSSICGRGVARLTCSPVTGKIAGSNPVGRAPTHCL